jgi:hypothetical protein
VRAHAHHLQLGPVVPAAAELRCHPLAHLAPDRLGVDQEPVQVENDGLEGNRDPA